MIVLTGHNPPTCQPKMAEFNPSRDLELPSTVLQEALTLLRENDEITFLASVKQDSGDSGTIFSFSSGLYSKYGSLDTHNALGTSANQDAWHKSGFSLKTDSPMICMKVGINQSYKGDLGYTPHTISMRCLCTHGQFCCLSIAKTGRWRKVIERWGFVSSTSSLEDTLRSHGGSRSLPFFFLESRLLLKLAQERDPPGELRPPSPSSVSHIPDGKRDIVALVDLFLNLGDFIRLNQTFRSVFSIKYVLADIIISSDPMTELYSETFHLLQGTHMISHVRKERGVQKWDLKMQLDGCLHQHGFKIADLSQEKVTPFIIAHPMEGYQDGLETMFQH
ncbi:hypothetical protein CHS0354_002716 [Potamilus streckersoni]|uniref:Uncharacterized protein n=1 Tax=Potamilus streckersoni TaxID=2493646 RepID=A0AAE0SK41_9BIVA|nr:hypothetical protein CHS0354_002716 [Potamilus streckersoni]